MRKRAARPAFLSCTFSFSPGAAGALNEPGLFATFQGALGIQKAVKLDEFGHESGPASLMAGTEPGAIVAVEVFVEQDVIAPVGIALELLRSAVHRTLATLVAVEAWALSPQLITWGQVSALQMPTPVTRYVTAQPGPFRVYSPRGLVSLAQAVAHGLETVDGNDPFQFGHYLKWANAAAGCDVEAYSVAVPTCAGNEVDPQAYLRAQPDGTLLGVGNVRYVITDHALSQWPSPVWQSGSTRIYENPELLPWAFVVPAVIVEPDDAAALAALRSRGPTQVATVRREPEYVVPSGARYHAAQAIRKTPNHIEVQADGPGWLVLSETWAPGWQASVDSVPVQVYRADVAFQGLPLGQGSHTVILMYAPTGWLVGRWVSLCGVVICVAVMAVALGRRLRA